jgi:hypothetical protein
MRESGKKWKRSIAAGLLGATLFTGVALGAEARIETRMQTQRRVATRSASVQRGRVVGFKPEGTDSWLCQYVSPFFCGYVPTVTAAPQPSAATTQRGRR